MQQATEIWSDAQRLSYRRDDQRVNGEKMIKEERGNYDTELSPQCALEKEGKKCSLKPHCLFIFPQNEIGAVACWQSSIPYFINPSSLPLLTGGALAENCGIGSTLKKYIFIWNYNNNKKTPNNYPKFKATQYVIRNAVKSLPC